ncbi:phosphatase [Legionella beliardensis]|uniref:Phosphatase n=1 Tax=Legionella beliardensis TaxID=91822 RepID=A0A378HYN0_9GAMM|nr:phosphatase [Legionella beliardensis]STX27872.1 phosphatase [Legionella beliardensis]
MRFLISLLILGVPFYTTADTINHYINIFNNIPKMEMKADPQAQAWARSARNILTLTDESIAETLVQGNELAKGQGKPLFCLPGGINLNAKTLHDIILRTYNGISSQQSDKDKMTVSQIAWLGVVQAYPCHSTQAPPGLGFNKQNQTMQHIEGGA